MKAIPKTAVTHGGKFHADDVFSAALLRILKPDVRIIRTSNIEKISKSWSEDTEVIFFDIGFGEFDHHQKDSAIRKNDIAYAAFGLLWQEFGASLVGEKEAAAFDESFIQPLDLHDNTGCSHTLADALGAFNPIWDSSEEVDICFDKAVEFAQAILERKIEIICGRTRAASMVQGAYSQMQDNIVVLPVFAPWKSFLIDTPALFVVYPSQRGGYCAQGIPENHESAQLKCPFPKEWAGCTSCELAELSGIATLHFCHNNQFMIAADLLEDTIAACRLSKKIWSNLV